MTASRPVALVTGAARRIGAAIVRRLHAAGYATMLHCHGSQDEARALAAELDAVAPGSADWLAGDLADPAVPAVLVDATLARFGRLDLLVNNAVLSPLRSIADTDVGLFTKTVEVDLRGYWYLSAEAA